MWKKIFLPLAILAISIPALKACDACGCGIGSIYWGILPNNNLHTVGLSWQNQHYTSHLGHDHEELLQSESAEYFNTLELRGRFYLNDRFSLSAIVPVGFHRRQSVGEWININGLGDISVMGNYRIFDSSDSLNHRVRHRFELGLGVKIPTGSFNALDTESVVNPNFQLGSGSWDFLFSANYTALMGQLGLQTNVTYKRNTTNSDDFRFGHRLNGSMMLFYRQNIKAFEFMPNLGLYGEWGGRDVENRYWQNNTGGHLLMSNVGIELYVSRYNFGASYLHPIDQDWSAGQVEAQARYTAHINVYF
ncbi:MAG: hypothetical protein DHS20C18_32580 [Saprospiraceae bacterium]|nr:MAG: hypothetical protein DHS20C18_32580 [Saprospiraceae bacterium]